MAVDLNDLVRPLKRTLTAPGDTSLDELGGSEMRGRLADAFWAARLQDFFVGYTIVDEAIVPLDETADDLSRAQQEIILQYASIRALEADLRKLPTNVRRKAGPVETETQRSANLLIALLKQATERLAQLRVDLQASLSVGSVTFLDGVAIAANRMCSEYGGVYGWVNG